MEALIARKVQAIGHMRNMDLSKGFNSWKALGEERRAMRRAIGRMFHGNMARAFGKWLQETQSAREAESKQQEEERHKRMLSGIQFESDAKIAELQAQLAAYQDAASDNARQEAERAIGAQLKKKQAAMRLVKPDSARAFGTWTNVADERRNMKSIAARMRSPGVSPAFARLASLARAQRKIRDEAAREAGFDKRMRDKIAEINAAADVELSLIHI